jgi:hypothetical protein
MLRSRFYSTRIGPKRCKAEPKKALDANIRGFKLGQRIFDV